MHAHEGPLSKPSGDPAFQQIVPRAPEAGTGLPVEENGVRFHEGRKGRVAGQGVESAGDDLGEVGGEGGGVVADRLVEAGHDRSEIGLHPIRGLLVDAALAQEPGELFAILVEGNLVAEGLPVPVVEEGREGRPQIGGDGPQVADLVAQGLAGPRAGLVVREALLAHAQGTVRLAQDSGPVPVALLEGPHELGHGPPSHGIRRAGSRIRVGPEGGQGPFTSDI